MRHGGRTMAWRLCVPVLRRVMMQVALVAASLLSATTVVQAQVDPRGAMRTLSTPHLRVHVRAARQLHKPLVIHTRSASADTLAILREERADQAGGVFHCFTETREVAAAALEMGFYISFSGILTFKNANDLREVALNVPLDRCLIETDSPYLAPMPYRGKTNNPAYVPYVAAELARIKGVSVEEIARATSANFDRLFKPV